MLPNSPTESVPSASSPVRLVMTWIAILFAVVVAMVLQSARHGEEPSEAAASAQVEVAPLGLEAQLQAKVAIALNGLRSMSPAVQPADILRNVEPLRDSPNFAERLGYAVLVGEIEGLDAGITSAAALATTNEPERTLRDAVLEVMEGRAESEEAKPSEDACAAIRPTLGYVAGVVCGDPAVEEAAMTMMIALIVAGGWYVLAFLGGLIALIIVTIALAKSTRAGVNPLAATPRQTAIVLGETFAIWLVAFFGLNIAAGLLGETLVGVLGLEGLPQGMHLGLALNITAFVGSLGVLAYPLMRGLRGSELRAVIGLDRGQGVVREALHGVACYFSAVPLLLAGLLIYLLLALIARTVFGHEPSPGHPVTELYQGADALRLALVFLIAAVAAPVVEEIMFRGVLFSHLRATVTPRLRLASLFVSAIVSSAIFALIHPQGVLFAPALGGLAVGFCLYREWRGSLIAPMVAHGINNAVTLTLGIMLMS